MIKRLPESVVNLIAAGEVVVRPSNAVKELIENSLDARAKEISITVTSGGFGKVVVEDDGCGIPPESLPLLCERFATSKIVDENDLVGVKTFGFRGEALASISQVAHVFVKTRIENGKIVEARYLRGQLVGSPMDEVHKNLEICSFTRIEFEDLFFENPIRRKALGGASEEYKKILEICQKFAIQYPLVTFSCRKGETGVVDLITRKFQVHNSIHPVLALLHGEAIAREISSFSCGSPLYQLSAWLSRGAGGVGWFQIFINGRLVECAGLRRGVEGVYSEIFPKGRKPFVALSLEVDPSTVDVNVHPTKKDVIFWNQSEIIESIKKSLSCWLKEIPKNFEKSDFKTTKIDLYLKANSVDSIDIPKKQIIAPSQKIRVDPSQQLLIPKNSDKPQIGFSQFSQDLEISTPEPEMIKIEATSWVGELNENFALVQKKEFLYAADVRKIALDALIGNTDAFSMLEISSVSEPVSVNSLMMEAIELPESGAFHLEQSKKEKLCEVLVRRFRENSSSSGWLISEDDHLAEIPRSLSPLPFSSTANLAVGVLLVAASSDPLRATFQWLLTGIDIHSIWKQWGRRIPESVYESGNFFPLAKLSALYREFERC